MFAGGGALILPSLLVFQADARIEKFEREVAPMWVAQGETAKPRSLGETLVEHAVPGMSVAIWEDGKIVVARTYGTVRQGTDQAPSPRTLFQAGSVSKSIVAVAALRLVDLGKVRLDDPVDRSLTSWKLPASTFTEKRTPTLRQLLNHTSGMGVHGFLGYAQGKRVPTLRQIMDGVSPANSPGLHFQAEPGKEWSYSGGGYLVIQQLVEDLAKTSFADWTTAQVLRTCGMKDSSLSQPLTEELLQNAAWGHVAERPVSGKGHVHPELAAAGLWTTATDLAKFGMAMQESLKRGGLLSRKLAGEAVVAGMGDYGLGFGIQGKGNDRWFGHGGRNIGFDSSLSASVEGGRGFAILINANCDTGILQEVGAAIGSAMGWKSPHMLRTRSFLRMSDAALDRLNGTYELPFGKISIERRGFRLWATFAPEQVLVLTPTATDAFEGPNAKVKFTGDEVEVTIGKRTWKGKKSG